MSYETKVRSGQIEHAALQSQGRCSPSLGVLKKAPKSASLVKTLASLPALE